MYHNEKTDAAFPELRSQRELDQEAVRGTAVALIVGVAVLSFALIGIAVTAWALTRLLLG